MNHLYDSRLLEQKRFNVSTPTQFKDEVTWENQVMTFQGTDTGIGTTFLSFATAWSAARTEKLRVAYFSLGSDLRKLWHYLGFTKAKVRMKHKQGWTYAQFDPMKAAGKPQDSSAMLLPNLSIICAGLPEGRWNPMSAEALQTYIRANYDLCFIDLHGDWNPIAAKDVSAGADACVNVITPLSLKLANPCPPERFIPASGRSDDSLDVLINQADSSTAMVTNKTPALKGMKLNVLGSVPWSREISEHLHQGKLQELLQTSDSLDKTAKRLLSACLNRSREML